MGVIDNIFTFIGSMHISAIIIIAIILVIFLFALLFIIVLKIKYGGLIRDVNLRASDAAAGRGGSGDTGSRFITIDDRYREPGFRNAFLGGVVAEFESAWSSHKGVEVNTQAIIENYFNKRAKADIILEGFTRHSVSVMIVFGLLGTFIGLTISVQSLVLLFRGYDVTELLGSVESGLLSALVGMSTAFTTSVFGVGCSVFITILSIFMNPGQARENLMTGIEEYLDNIVSSGLKTAMGDEYDQMNNTLRNIFVEFGERIAERFDRSLTTLRDDVRGIEEVNNNLRNTIEQMDVCFVRIADALKASTRHVDENYQAISGLSARFKDMSGEYEASRRDGAVQSEKLVKSVGEAAQAITSLTGDLRGEAQRRLDSFSAYEEAVNRMAASAALIRDAVAVIPEQMYAYSIASGSRVFQTGVKESGAPAGEPGGDTNNPPNAGAGAEDETVEGGWSRSN